MDRLPGLDEEEAMGMAEHGGQVLSIEELARETGLEESLLRFYESEYGAELPEKILRGGGLFFAPQAVESFRALHARCRLARAANPEGRIGVAGGFARVVAVTSGKGGVGKSNLTLNLAIELQRLGKRCLVLDADMGMANVHLLAGLRPSLDIMSVLNGQAEIAEVIMQGPEGIGVIPGGGGIARLADSTRPERLRIVRALEGVERNADFILLDTGAGMSSAVRDFLITADDVLFVLTPDITSLADAYGLLKTLHRERSMADRSISSVINMVHSLQEAADVARRFSECARQFLGLSVTSVGYIMKDATVGAATFRRTPYTVFRPMARVSVNTRNVAKALLQGERDGSRLSSSFGRYLKLLQE